MRENSQEGSRKMMLFRSYFHTAHPNTEAYWAVSRLVSFKPSGRCLFFAQLFLLG